MQPEEGALQVPPASGADRYATGINGVLGQVHPGHTIDKSAVSAVDDICHDVVLRLLASVAEHDTEALAPAITSVMTKELAKHGNTEVKKAAGSDATLMFKIGPLQEHCECELPPEFAACLCACAEYICAEVVELAGNKATERGGGGGFGGGAAEINLQDLRLSVAGDEELNQLLPEEFWTEPRGLAKPPEISPAETVETDMSDSVPDEEVLKALECSTAVLTALSTSVLEAASRQLAGIGSKEQLAHSALLQEIPGIVSYANTLGSDTMEDGARQLMRLLRECSRLRSHLQLAARIDASETVAVESPHPYVEADVFSRTVQFEPHVKWCLVSIDKRSRTCQPEDRLLIIDAQGACIRMFSGTSEWGAAPFVVKGSSVTFELATATDYIKAGNADHHFGFAASCTSHHVDESSDAASLALNAFESGMLFQLLEQVTTHVECDMLGSWLDSRADRARKLSDDVLFRGGLQTDAYSDDDALGGATVEDIDVGPFREFARDFGAMVDETQGQRLAKWLATYKAEAEPEPEPEPDSQPEPEADTDTEPEPELQSKPEPEPESEPTPTAAVSVSDAAGSSSAFSFDVGVAAPAFAFGAASPPKFSMGLAAVPNQSPPRSKRQGKGEANGKTKMTPSKQLLSEEVEVADSQDMLDMPAVARQVFCAVLWHSGAGSDAMVSATHLKFLKEGEKLPELVTAIVNTWEQVNADLSEAAPPGHPQAWMKQVSERAQFLLLAKSACENELSVHRGNVAEPEDEDELLAKAATVESTMDSLSQSALGRQTSVPSIVHSEATPPELADFRTTVGSMDAESLLLAIDSAAKVGHGALSRSHSLAPRSMAQKVERSTGTGGLSQPSVGLTRLIDAETFEVATRCKSFIYHGTTDVDSGQTDSPALLKRLGAESARVALSRLKGMRLLNSLMSAEESSHSVLYDCFWCLAKLLDLRTLSEEHMLSGLWTTEHLKDQLRQEFHSILGRVAGVLQQQAAMIQQPDIVHDPAVIRAALRCFRNCNFAVADHDFLQGSQVLSSIGEIERASSTEGLAGDPAEEGAATGTTLAGDLLERDKHFKVKTSSNDAMSAAVFDDSTETFWEADAQDHEASFEITPEQGLPVSAIRLHVDNSRDADRKCTSISLTVSSLGAKPFVTSCKVPAAFGGWLMLPVPSSANYRKSCKYKFLFEGGGMDHQFGAGNRLNPRLRGMKFFGSVKPPAADAGGSTALAKIMADEAIQVFRSVARSVVFGPPSSAAEPAPDAAAEEGDAPGDAPGGAALVRAGSVNLREHVVSLLFSGGTGKLPPLQSQVCSLIFGELQQEAARMQGAVARNEASLGDDTFTFELSSLVLTLSGTAAGLRHIASLPGTIATICTLLQIGSARLQRQAMTIIKRVVLQTMTPAQIDLMLKPRLQFVRSAGFGGLLLALVARGFSGAVQLRSPGSPLAAVHMENAPGLKLDARVDWEIATELVSLIASASSSAAIKSEWSDWFEEKSTSALHNLAEDWANQDGAPREGGGAALWHAIAVLSVIESSLAEELSKGARTPRLAGEPVVIETVFCTNHDDGTTAALFRCAECGPSVALCAQCDSCLHLPKAARGHKRTVVEQQEENLSVSINDGTARVKTQFGVLAVDRENGKAVCELKLAVQPITDGGAACRFCQSAVPAGAVEVAGIEGVCDSEECLKYAESACVKAHACGHSCGGIRNEEACLACLQCADAEGLCVDADDFCSVCWTDNLGAAPCIQMDCGHVFHASCVNALVDRRWPGPAITFGFADCPCCKAELLHPSIEDTMMPIRAVKDDIRRKAGTRLKFEGKDKDPEVIDKNSKWFEDHEGYAMDKYNYYQCFKCEKPYFGGERQCGAAADDSFNPEELICPGCVAGDAAQICPKHGTDFLEYKCRYCCSVAVWFCFGTTHFCEPCHNENGKMQRMQEQGKLPPCPCGPVGVPLPPHTDCPIGGGHPAPGEEYALGCGVCRNAQTF